ncbi:MAG: FAD-dependent oxidoreductase [Proteobacteria bacterium]|nr:FAD-dependent oxidoreductase [Pseudomonadota bacterium]
MTDARTARPRHCVAVIGGATAGAEVAGRLAELDAEVVVFEMNPRPYGKIEDGLPRWHKALRRKEYETISGKLTRAGVHFVPNTKVGRDVGFEELVQDWGFSAVVLACGAWSDRALPVEGADDYLGRGLVYQNPFIIWFNHAGEAAYDGPRFQPEDGVLVVGGGLASIDVVKVLMVETARAALAERGIEVPMLELEVKGIPKVLKAHGLRFEDLGLEGCTLAYRRRVEDMPLVEAPEGATPERMEKVRGGRRKLIDKAMEKYRFKMEPLAMPDGLLVEDDRLVGIRFRRTRIEDGRVIPTDETFELRGSYVISSIGSIPEPLPGIDMKGELFAFTDWDFGRLEGRPTVFSVGNVVTGKGNIVASRKHAAAVSHDAIEKFLGLDESGHEGEETLASAAREQADRVADAVGRQPPLDPASVAKILERVHLRQNAVGYGGDYADWIAQVTPPDLE